MIPKIIHTAWFGEEMPTTVVKSLISQVDCANQFDYKHKIWDETYLMFEEDLPEYIKTAVLNKKWVKATDYLRAWVLQKEGGIFLDADMEVLPGKNFDDLLHMELFAAREENGFVGYSLVGSEPNHPIWEEYFKQVNEKFTPLDGKNFESSMELFTHIVYGRKDVEIHTPDYFFPYNHQTGIINVTPNTRTFHHFMKTWTDISPDLLPTVSIIIPQFGRPEGLKRCLDSIDKLYYPKHLIETIVIEGEETVPQKVKKGFEQSKGDRIVYAANDVEFTPISLYEAVESSQYYGLVAFNTGEVSPDEGNICEHFLIRRDFIPKLENGEIFSTEFHHVGCDNWLWEQAKRLGEAVWDEPSVMHHYHFTKGAEYDEIYDRGWKHQEADRELLKKKLALC